MNNEQVFMLIIDSINKKKFVSTSDIAGLTALGIPACDYIGKCASLDEFLSEVYYFWSLQRNEII